MYFILFFSTPWKSKTMHCGILLTIVITALNLLQVEFRRDPLFDRDIRVLRIFSYNPVSPEADRAEGTP